LRGEVVLKGRILDLGSGGSGYLDRLRREGRVFPVTVDIRPEARPNIIANLERGLPFRDRSIETVLLHNVLEHVAGCEELVREISRVLAPGGLLYLSMPFLMPVHERHGAFPYRDYRRLTAAALEKLVADFAAVRFHVLEVGPFLAAFHIAGSAVPLRAARCGMAGFAWVADLVYTRLRRRRDVETQMRFVLGYLAVAER
jgi:SAM-dependent methyltransferase